MIDARSGRDIAPIDDGQRGTVWHGLTFGTVAIGWAPMSLIAWFSATIGTLDWTGDATSGVSRSTFDGPVAIVAIVLSTGLFALGGVVLFSLARWAFPGRRRLATALGLIGLVWAPIVATAWTVAR